MGKNGIRAGVGIGALAFAMALVPAGIAAADSSQQSTLDLDGNGTLDSARLSAVGDGSQQVIQFTVDGRTTEATLTGDAYAGTRPMRVLDVNNDGRQELLVTESVGANTEWFGIWDLGADGAPRELTTQDGAPLKINEGGGVAARLGYECGPAGSDGRVLITLAASNESQAPEPAYDGKRIAHDVRDGVAAPVDEYPFAGVGQDDPVLDVAPDSCA
ncbi:VCBS repeat-containing protein [Saccharopolyspora gloriosae]|uniref:FG-GAP repeat domain-containing protein n=1 Tax=Saccharopolyspora gloriosae TaxID=455344 RepID=UPI001FB738B6|nr:VCBS repeat-containing protein [Saccharopolyspora gloriosae]